MIPLSFEFFPPRDAAGRDKLTAGTAEKLATLNPEYFSVTYGAGGSTKAGTRQTITDLTKRGWNAVPHLSVDGNDLQGTLELVAYYKELGIKKILCLRGDQAASDSDNSQYAEDLVRLIRQHFGDSFKIIVGAYPEVHPDSATSRDDLMFFKRKVDAGADVAITQYFYNVEAYAYFVQHSQRLGIDIPIVPGIMPITNYASLCRFSEKAGADIPRWLDRAMAQRQASNDDLNKFGVEVVTRLCEQLIELGAPALHFYTLNRWGATTKVCANLGQNVS
ncbi:MAG: methylenetetrahydrofolate reductase [Candidatus Azotimanducaceae bacterium]